MSNSPAPRWLTQLQWQGPRPGSTVQRRDIPEQPGCYVFTDKPLIVPPVLYVGRAVNLKRRVWGYLLDYAKTKPTKHKGRAFIYDYRHTHGDHNLYVSWAVYGDPIGLEGSLIGQLEPLCNSRYEGEFLSDEDFLDEQFLP